MHKACKHCGIRYVRSEGQGAFCCSGCESVYESIRAGGYGDYYRRQDRVGRPVDAGALKAKDFVLAKQLQAQTPVLDGICQAVVGVQGMSCMGCVWLIEQLAKRASGVVHAKVALDSNQLSLEWKAGHFDLVDLAREMQRFGYRMTATVSGFMLPSLTIRLLLTLLFSFNGLLLTFADLSGVGAPYMGQFYMLLTVACMVFALLTGGTLFLVPAWRGLQFRRIHSDLLPSLAMLVPAVWACYAFYVDAITNYAALLFFVMLPVMVFARWLAQGWILKPK
ncbi:MAG: heavy metal translocating P-type ATPase metal-binding domain-containing protein [Opitutales bacterium]